jgi:hypothetical protein
MSQEFFDTETGVIYDGSKEMQEHIYNNITPAERKELKKVGLKRNNVYPILDATKGILGCVMRKGVRPKFFNLLKNPDALWDYFIKRTEAEGKRDKTVEVFSHNAEFDWYVIAKNHLFDKRITFKSNKTFIREITTEHGKITFRDSHAFFKMPLKKVGDMVKLQKLEMPGNINSIEELKEYCERDTLIVMKAIRRLKAILKNKFNYTPKRLTSPSKLAYNLFQRECKNSFHIKTCADGTKKKVSKGGYWWYEGKIYQTKDPEFLHLTCRGGMIRCLNTKRKITNATKVDLNSAYPFVCYSNDYKFPDIRKEKIISEEDLNKHTPSSILNQLGVIECLIKSPLTDHPYLPIRYKGKVIYPVGTSIKGFWTIPEIKYAVEECGYKLLEINKAITYPALPFNIFRDFFDELYNLKQTLKDVCEKHVIKLMMNSLTGKFAQRISESVIEDIPISKHKEYMRRGYNPLSLIPGTPLIRMERIVKRKHYSKTSNPIINALITAYTRILMHKHMRKIPREDLLYASTDAIIFKGDHLDKFDIGNKMGQWKIEGKNKTYEGFETGYYKFDQTIKTSGTKKAWVSEEHIREGIPFKQLNMITEKSPLGKSNPALIGTFQEKFMKIKATPETPYPDFIEERLFSQIKSTTQRMEEIGKLETALPTVKR